MAPHALKFYEFRRDIIVQILLELSMGTFQTPIVRFKGYIPLLEITKFYENICMSK